MSTTFSPSDILPVEPIEYPPFLSDLASIISTTEMVYETEQSKGIPSGALTILIIAAVAIISVVITLFCMLVSNKRSRRAQRLAASVRARMQPPSRSPIPSFARPTSTTPLPLYITPSVNDPKFDAPPSYEEALRSVPLTPCSPISPTPTSTTTMTRVTIEEPAQIDAQQEMADRPSTSSSGSQ